MTDIPLSCACGHIKGTVKNATPAHGNHVGCYCASCQAGVLYCGMDNPAPEPVELFQTTADNITFSSGQDKLVPFAFGPRNLLRWKAACCDVQLFSTPRNVNMPLVGVITARLENLDSIGPVNSLAFIPKKGGKTGHKNIGALLTMIARCIGKRMNGQWRQTPFFNLETKKPRVDVVLVSQKEKAALFKP